MRILYVHRTRGQGAEGAHIRQVIKALRECGHEVNLVSFSQDTDPLEALKNPVLVPKPPSVWMNLIHKITTKIPAFVFEIFELAYNAILYFRLKKAIIAFQPDLIYERYAMFTIAGLSLARSKGIPLLYEVNDSAVVPRVRPLVFTFLGKWIEKKCFHQASGLIFVSNEFKNLCQAQYGSLRNSIVSPNAADLTVFNSQLFNREQIREELGVKDKVVCGYIGAFVKWHGIEQFVHTIASKMAQSPDLVLLLLGDGVSFDAVKEFVKDQGLEHKILLPGRVPHQHVAKMVAAMDFSVLPNSATYNSPMKLFEAMAMGVAVVAPNYGPITEVIEDHQTGWLFTIDDMEQCARLVLDIAQDKTSRDNIGQAARTYIYEHRQWIHNAQQIIELYQNSLSDQAKKLDTKIDPGITYLGFIDDMRFKQSIYQEDAKRSIPLIKIILSDGSSANFLYRLMRYLVRYQLKPLAFIIQYINKLLNQCVIGMDADFAGPCAFLHPTGVIINSKVRAGSYVAIESAVVIGDEKGQSPQLQDHIFIGAGAKILGPIHIGSNSKIGANAVVVKDVRSGTTVVGIPAKELPIKLNQKDDTKSDTPLDCDVEV